MSSTCTNSAEQCLVCGKLTSTTHLQVSICYGCAAFYRRSINAQRIYKCKFNTGKCDLSTQTILCRSCRFNKCKTLNLVIKKSKEAASLSPSLELSPIPSNESSNDLFFFGFFYFEFFVFKEDLSFTAFLIWQESSRS